MSAGNLSGRFLHAHPFYNSEQQSQRYVRLDHAHAYVPPEGERFGAAERAIYEHAVARAWAHYRELTAILEPEAREILGDIWHIGPMSHPRRVEKVEGASGEARDRSCALRFARRCGDDDGAHAFRHRAAPAVADAGGLRHACGIARRRSAMVDRVREIDPQFFDRFDKPMPIEEMPEWTAASECCERRSIRAGI